MRKNILFPLCLALLMIIVVVALALFFKTEKNRPVSLIKSETRFYGFTVVNDKVIVEGSFALKNTSGEEKRVRVYALASPLDVIIGLLKTSDMYVFDDNGDFRILTIPANSKAYFDDIEFVGEFNWNPKMFDGVLQKIIIEIVEETE